MSPDFWGGMAAGYGLAVIIFFFGDKYWPKKRGKHR